MDVERETTGGLNIPWERLSAAALEGVIDEFVTREGTDYGHGEPDLTAKRADVMRQLRSGDAVISFDPATKTCTLLRTEDAPGGRASRARRPRQGE